MNLTLVEFTAKRNLEWLQVDVLDWIWACWHWSTCNILSNYFTSVGLYSPQSRELPISNCISKDHHITWNIADVKALISWFSSKFIEECYPASINSWHHLYYGFENCFLSELQVDLFFGSFLFHSSIDSILLTKTSILRNAVSFC